ncbi:MAG TPA: peptidylprolyl isomerase [Thiotrichales bacterium]|nr:peptidylprolyl isomerase [Thiotrichales bacterium]
MVGPDQIRPGSRVRLHLRLSLADGTVVEDTHGEEPMVLRVGDGSLAPGLELALYGMRPGQSGRVTLHPDQAYGQRDPALVKSLPRDCFSAEMVPEPGLLVEFETDAGEAVPGLVLGVGEEEVEVDFNHPLAGKPVIFECEILEVDNQGLEDE